MKSLNFVFFAISVFIFLCFSSCKHGIVETPTHSTSNNSVSEYDYQVVYDWNNLFLDLERYSQKYRPCPSAHFLGYYGIANYQACIQGMADYNSMAHLFSGLQITPPNQTLKYHWPSVINRISYSLFSKYFNDLNADLFTKINALYLKNERNYTAEINNSLYIESKNYGDDVAEAVWNWMKTDAILFQSEKDPFRENNWRERNNPFDWQPTNPMIQNGLYPYFGKGRPMAIGQSEMLCQSYKKYVDQLSEDNNSRFYLQAKEVSTISTKSLSFDDKWLVEFWYDDIQDLTFSTVGRWLSISNQVLLKEKSSLDMAIWTNAALGMTLHDAAIGIWNSKYHYNIERPISFINRVIDPTWKPMSGVAVINENIQTPSYPSYPSAQAGFAGAASEILSQLFGYNYKITDNSHADKIEFFGMPRSGFFNSLALESSFSRVILGMNYRIDVEEGQRYGELIGRKIGRLDWKKP